MPKKRAPMPMETPGFGWRVGLSVFVVFGWLIFLIIWLLFFAGGMGIYQNLAVIFVSILVGIALLASAWASWGVKYGWKYGKEWQGKKQMCEVGHSCKNGGAIYGLGFIGALIYFVTTAPTFWDAVIGVLKAIVWPAFLVYAALKSLGL